MSKGFTSRWVGGRLYFVSTFTSTRLPLRSVVENPPALPEGNPHFLFSAPEYSKAFEGIFAEILEQMAERKSPVVRQIVTRAPGDRVQTQRVTSPNGEVVSIEPQQLAMPYRFTAEDVIRFDLGAFGNACDAAAEVYTDSQLDHMLNATSAISDAFGKSGDARGQAFGWGVLLPALDKLDIDFSDTGEPLLPKMVAENDKRNFVEYPPLTPEHRAAFDELMTRKRKEYDARRGRR